jgi:hypothetical protein
MDCGNNDLHRRTQNLPKQSFVSTSEPYNFKTGVVSRTCSGGLTRGQAPRRADLHPLGRSSQSSVVQTAPTPEVRGSAPLGSSLWPAQ